MFFLDALLSSSGYQSSGRCDTCALVDPQADAVSDSETRVKISSSPSLPDAVATVLADGCSS